MRKKRLLTFGFIKSTINLMLKNSERGFAQIIFLLIIVIGIGVGVYLVSQKGNLYDIFRPKASISEPIGPESSLSLITYTQGSYLEDSIRTYKVGDQFGVAVKVRSDVDSINLITAKIKYDPNILELSSYQTADTNDTNIASANTKILVINNWVEQFVDNKAGEASFVGGVPSPGIKTTVGSLAPDRLVNLIFRAKTPGKTTISIQPDSALFRDFDNQNILNTTRDLKLIISSSTSSPSPTPPNSRGKICAQVITYAIDPNTNSCRQYSTPCAIPESWIRVLSCEKPSPTPINSRNKGDANNDGKVSLVDMSVVLTLFNKSSASKPGTDLNGDGIVNTFDFGLLRNLFVEFKIIRGK